ncbi:hypothetical protein IT408_00715 [Candidatus Uhrbacteria bacterium]|nr:hypothetical protein [Candidatus Uhrbacteria bacterium]
MKRFSSLIFGSALLLSPFTSLPASAATLSPGDLIKGPGEAVYYYGTNGKRLVFPTSKTYFTWYSDFSQVKTVTAGELAEIPLGGNATYRPGVKLVKITTDPKVYAVASNGTLRWIETEQVVKDLYGADWNTKIDDIPDAFFINYTIGSSVKNASDFQPSAQTAAALDINTDRALGNGATTNPIIPTLPTTPSSTPSVPDTNGSLTFTQSKTTLQSGDILSLTTQASHPSGIKRIELYFDDTLIKSCDVSFSCNGETQIPLSGTKSAYTVKTIVTTLSQTVLTESKTLPVAIDDSSKVRISLGQSTITPNQAASIVADIDSSIAILRVDLSVNGIIVKGCADGARQCRWSDVVSGANVGQSMPVFARVTDTLGRTYTSKTLTLTIGTNDSPSVVVTPVKTSIFAGESLEVTVSASDNDGISQIDVMNGNVVLKSCMSAQPCTVSTGPWMNAETFLLFSGAAKDTKGMTGTADATDVVHVVAH